MSRRRPRSLPPALLATAERQKDLLLVEQILAEGVSYHAIAGLAGAGLLHRLHRGVYKVGTPTPSSDGRRLAAVHAAGPGAVVSHRDAAELHGLALSARSNTVDVTATRGRADRPGITLHRVRRLDPADVMKIRGIPVTRLARTLIDLADVLSPSELRRVIHETEVANRFDLIAIDAAMRRASGRNLRAIRAAIDGHRPRPTREIEQLLARVARRAGLRGGQPNARTLVDREDFELDRYYPHLRLCLEADGYRVHKTQRKFNSDRRRDRILKLRLGITTLRYTWEDLTERTRECEAELAPYAELQRHLEAEGANFPDAELEAAWSPTTPSATSSRRSCTRA